ncbi:Glu/Leu/Phe/Val dehydrogenase dimerization domain-containing protein [Chloroflexota bacterium]
MSELIEVNVDDKSNIRGYLAIDSTVNGRSYGGVRMASDLSSELIAQLARRMTLKYGFVGLPVGGAKAGIAVDPELPLPKKLELLNKFGQELRPFLKSRRYVPGTDMGTTDDDIRFMLSANSVKHEPRGMSWGLSGFYTGITVFAAAVSVADQIGLDLNRARVAIEGFGHVGVSAAQMFWERNMRVVAVSTNQGAVYDESGLNMDELIRLSQKVGSQMFNVFARGEKIDKRRLPELEVDIFCPCAQHHSLTSENADRINARIISPAANLPTTAEAEQTMLKRGIISIPDFVANCGGVLGVSMKRSGLKEDYIRGFLQQKVGEQAVEVIRGASEENAVPTVYAEAIAMESFHRVQEAAEKKSIANRAFNLALELYRDGIVPYQMVTPFARRYFERRFR